MKRAIAVVVFMIAAPAMADATPRKPAKAAKAPAANPNAVAPATAKTDAKTAAVTPAAKAEAPAATKGCKKQVIGRGLDRKVVCVIESEIDVNAGPPTPNVIVVHQSPREVVGRPKSESRLKGLPQRLNP